MSEKGKEIFGEFTLDGIVFEAGYRYGGDLGHQGGYHKCLRIYSGKDATNNRIDGHGYFGDDKFEVASMEEYVDDIVLQLTFPLTRKEDRYKIFNNGSKTIIIKRK